MSITHKCPHQDCQVQVPGSRLACRTHWYKVSPATRALLAALWSADDEPAEYFEVRERAVQEMNA